jgi:hypothetical protein
MHEELGEPADMIRPWHEIRDLDTTSLSDE